MGSRNGLRRPKLAITLRPWAREGTTMTIAGELDLAGVAALQRAVQDALGAGHRHLVVDLSATTFVDCAALRELLHAVRPLRDDGDAAVVLTGPTGPVRRLLQILHFDTLIGTVESREIAIDACQRRPTTLPDGWRRVRP
jgi:anti-anti-sigma factor